MRRFGVLCLLAGIVCPALHADEPRPAAMKKLAKEIVDSVVKGDYAKAIDTTHPAIVKEMGGRQKAIEIVETTMQQMKAQGYAIKSAEVGEPGQFLSEGKNAFVVIPTTME